MIIGNHMKTGVGNNSHTLYLVQSDSTNGSVVFTDTSAGGSAKVVAALANAEHSSAQSIFGAATSIHTAATGDIVGTVDHADFVLDMDDFCIDLWVRPATVANTRNVFGQMLAGQLGAYIVQPLIQAG